MMIPVKLYNNLTRSKVEFKTKELGKVRFYSCGPTTYDFLHIGNARALVVGDLFNRILSALGYDVTFVRNFTDVDDKIIQKANECRCSALEHSQKYVDECLADMEALNMLPANHTPKVSETMPEIIQMIQTLIDKKYAYVVEGEVFYSVPHFEGYGKLSKKKLEDLEHGKRVGVDEKKLHPSDFVLWKPAKEGEPSWVSPWGNGRPGWHIECSAMSKKFLGDTIDLHHGGVDLIFPHHENEIAQSEAANGVSFCNHWCHNEFLNFGSTKMSKSLGNVITIRKFCETYGGALLRQVLASVHYRSRMEWSDEVVKRGLNDLERLHNFVRDLKNMTPSQTAETGLKSKCELIKKKIQFDLSSDFNVTGALGNFFSLVRDVNRDHFVKNIMSAEEKSALEDVVDFFGKATGLIHENLDDVFAQIEMAKKNLNSTLIQNETSDLSDHEIEELIVERNQARLAKDWGKADEIKKRFQANGITLTDQGDGTTLWKK